MAPALVSLIYDGDTIIGYITEKGEPVKGAEHEIKNIPPSFLETFLRTCKRRGKVYYDLVPPNVVRLKNGQYSLIDLESVYDISPNLESDLQQGLATLKPANIIDAVKNID